MNAQLHSALIQSKLSYGLNCCENIEQERKGYLFEIQLSIYSDLNYTCQQQVEADINLVKRITTSSYSKCRKHQMISSKGKDSSKMIIFIITVDTYEFFFAEKDLPKIKRIVLQIGAKMFATIGLSSSIAHSLLPMVLGKLHNFISTLSIVSIASTSNFGEVGGRHVIQAKRS